MNKDNSALKIIGPIVGAVVLIVLVYMAVSNFQTDVRATEPGAPAEAVAETEAKAEEAAPAPEEAAAPEAETAEAASEEAPAEAAETTSAPAGEPVAVAQIQAPEDVVAAFNKGGCGNCHTIAGVPGATGTVGPNLSEIGAVAASRKEGYTAEEYIRESILDPNAFIAPECPNGPCPAGVMLQSFGETLSEKDLDTIVNYLAALGTDKMAEFTGAEAMAPESIPVELPPESVLEPFQELPKEPADEALIVLGKYLFFDPRLSGNVSPSCASCHQPDKAWADGQALSRGYPSTSYFRNTPTLLNTAYAEWLYWDGRMDGGDMPTLVRDHLTEAHFMSMDGRLMAERLKQVPAYVELFDKAFGGEPSFGKVLKAITAYVQTLNSPPTPYDQYLAGDTEALSEDAKAGLALFQDKAQCSTCHSGPLFTDNDFHNIGVATDQEMFNDPERHLTFRRFFYLFGVPNYRSLREDVGRYALTKMDEDWGKFRTPSLREVSRTAPYMHNGSLATLEDVVRFYNEGGGPNQTAGLEPLNLTDEEIGQLVAFLESLSSEPIPVEEPTLPDYGIVPLGSTEVEPMAEEAAPAEEETAPAEEAAGPSELALEGFQKGGCAACHVIPGVPGAMGQVGPDLSNVAAEVAERVKDMTVEEYLHQSIVDPNADIAPNCPSGACPANVMPPNFAETLSEEEINAIVEYLASLGNGR